MPVILVVAYIWSYQSITEKRLNCNSWPINDFLIKAHAHQKRISHTRTRTRTRHWYSFVCCYVVYSHRTGCDDSGIFLFVHCWKFALFWCIDLFCRWWYWCCGHHRNFERFPFTMKQHKKHGEAFTFFSTHFTLAIYFPLSLAFRFENCSMKMVIQLRICHKIYIFGFYFRIIRCRKMPFIIVFFRSFYFFVYLTVPVYQIVSTFSLEGIKINLSFASRRLARW